MKRREELLELLENASEPQAGADLAERLGVTRQVIVRDVALLRAAGHTVLSTPRGYLLQRRPAYGCQRVICVCHTKEQIAQELTIIIDLGGRAMTTIVEHPVYGYMEEDLNVGSGKELRAFLARISDSAPLLSLTGGIHRHRVWAPTEAVLDEICRALAEKGLLISC